MDGNGLSALLQLRRARHHIVRLAPRRPNPRLDYSRINRASSFDMIESSLHVGAGGAHVRNLAAHRLDALPIAFNDMYDPYNYSHNYYIRT